jgi:hypothetical protein
LQNLKYVENKSLQFIMKQKQNWSN